MHWNYRLGSQPVCPTPPDGAKSISQSRPTKSPPITSAHLLPCRHWSWRRCLRPGKKTRRGSTKHTIHIAASAPQPKQSLPRSIHAMCSIGCSIKRSTATTSNKLVDSDSARFVDHQILNCVYTPSCERISIAWPPTKLPSECP